MRSTSSRSSRSISARTSSMLRQSLDLRGAMSLALGDHGVGLDLDQIVGIDEGRDLKRRVGRPGIAEEFAVHAPDRVEMGHVDKIDTGANHILEACAGIG